LLTSFGAVSVEQVFPDFNPGDTVKTNRDGTTVRLINLARYYRIEFNDSVWWEDLRAAWAGDSSFQIVGQAQYFVADEVVPNDPLFWAQNHFDTHWAGGGHPMIPLAWEYTTGSPTVKIGIIDNGFDLNHVDLDSRIVETYRASSGGADAWPVLPDEDHGTHVAGIAGAATDNGIGVAGVNWCSPLYLARAAEHFSILGVFEGVVFRDDHAAQCINWLRDHNADVLNMSFGYTDNFWSETFKSIFFGNAMAAASYNAWAADVLLVASKGNDASTDAHRPSDYRTVMGIGSCTIAGELSSFSNYGAGLDVTTLGEDIYSTELNDTYGPKTGTSMAAPIATGVASLLKSYRPDLTADEIEQIIELMAKDRGDVGWDAQNGWGNIKADSALRFIAHNDFFRLNATSFSRNMVQGQHEHYFVNEGSPGQSLASGVYFVETWRLVHHFDFPEYYFDQLPAVLIRHRGAQGWSAENPNPMFPHGRVVPGTLTTSGCDIETYAYFVKFNILGQTINQWYPCNEEVCTGNPDVNFQITLAGRPGVIPPDYFDAGMHWDPFKQVVEVYFSDPNLHEAGYIIERKPATTGVWERVDSLGPQEGPYVTYWDSTYTGSEVYSYRVGACRAGRPTTFTDIVTFKTQPRHPDYFDPYVYQTPGECGGPVPSETYPGLGKPGPGPDDPPSGSCPSNKIIIEWEPPANQRLPIDYYRVTRTRGYYVRTEYYTDSPRLEICPNRKNTTYGIEIMAFDVEGDSSKTLRKSVHTGWQDVCLGNITKADEEAQATIPGEPTLSQNFPNPFNATTTITFSLPEQSRVRVDVFNNLGQLVTTLIDKELDPGIHAVTWDAAGEASGVYLYRLMGGSFTATRKMMLVK